MSLFSGSLLASCGTISVKSNSPGLTSPLHSNVAREAPLVFQKLIKLFIKRYKIIRSHDRTVNIEHPYSTYSIRAVSCLVLLAGSMYGIVDDMVCCLNIHSKAGGERRKDQSTESGPGLKSLNPFLTTCRVFGRGGVSPLIISGA